MISDMRVHYLQGLKDYMTQSCNDDTFLQDETSFNIALVDIQHVQDSTYQEMLTSNVLY